MEDCRTHVPLVSTSVPGVLSGQQILPLGQHRLLGVKLQFGTKELCSCPFGQEDTVTLVFGVPEKTDFWIQ